LLAQGRSPADIAVVARGWRPLEGVKSALDKLGIPARLTRERGGQDQPEVKLTTLHSSKGLEFPVVFLVGLDMLETGADVFAEEIRLLYVGMTRATDLLYLSAARSAPMVDHVAAALERLQPEAATA
jgi:superfamily I DNA/RNA helicase